MTEDQPVTGDGLLRFPAPTQTQIPGYHVDSPIGRGGMAAVYRARDLRLDRWVALKVLAPEFFQNAQVRERFLQESRLAASLDHPNIVPIFEAGDVNGVLYIAMRYVEGGDLTGLLNARGPLDLPTTVAILSQVAAGLDAAHARGLVHRDVKPGNVLLATAQNGQVPHAYLSDFGITKRASSLSGVTTFGQFIGTMDYAAPEQIGRKPLDARTDVYALGCVAYQCLTGAVPFHRDDEAALLWAHLIESPPPLSSHRPELEPVDAVVAQAISKSAEQRYASCGAFATALAAAAGLPGTGRTLPPVPPTWSAPPVPATAPISQPPVPPQVTQSPVTRPPVPPQVAPAAAAISSENPTVLGAPADAPAPTAPPTPTPTPTPTPVAAPVSYPSEAATGLVSAGTAPMGPGDEPAKKSRRPALIAAAVAVILVGGGVGGFAATRSDSGSKASTTTTAGGAKATGAPAAVATSNTAACRAAITAANTAIRDAAGIESALGAHTKLMDELDAGTISVAEVNRRAPLTLDDGEAAEKRFATSFAAFRSAESSCPSSGAAASTPCAASMRSAEDVFTQAKNVDTDFQGHDSIMRKLYAGQITSDVATTTGALSLRNGIRDSAAFDSAKTTFATTGATCV